MLLPFQGENNVSFFTQGVALGWLLVGLSGRFPLIGICYPDTRAPKGRKH